MARRRLHTFSKHDRAGPMPESIRRHLHGKLQPMDCPKGPSLLSRLLERCK